MLKAEHRLRRSRDFTSAVRQGVTARRGSVVVHMARARNCPSGPAKVGFVVGRAVGGAVVRNTVRRRLRHQVAGRVAGLPMGATVVVRALPSSVGRSSALLGDDLEQAMSRATNRLETTGSAAGEAS